MRERQNRDRGTAGGNAEDVSLSAVPGVCRGTRHGVCLGLLLLLFLCPGLLHAQLQAGAAKVSITPDPQQMPYTLGGYGDRARLSRNATGVHDTCYARALVLSNGTTRQAFVSLDLCYLPVNVRSAVLGRMKGTGFDAAHVFLSATHTHSAPEPLLLHDGNTRDAALPATLVFPQYDAKLCDWFADRIAQSIREAEANRRPARVGSGQAHPIGMNRNRRGETVTDDEMTVLKVVSAEDKPIAALVVYAAHPTYYGADMFEVSGDWASAFAQTMETSLPGAVVLFLNGAEGDASPSGADNGTPAERIAVYAARLAAKAKRLFDRVTVQKAVTLRGWAQTVVLPERQPHPLFLLAASQFKATSAQAKELVRRLMPAECDLTFAQVGEVLFLGFPGEPTAPLGLAAKALAREKGFPRPAVVALTNGWLGYLVTEAQYRAGKYEPTMSFYGAGIGAVMLQAVKEGLGNGRAVHGEGLSKSGGKRERN